MKVWKYWIKIMHSGVDSHLRSSNTPLHKLSQAKLMLYSCKAPRFELAMKRESSQLFGAFILSKEWLEYANPRRLSNRVPSIQMSAETMAASHDPKTVRFASCQLSPAPGLISTSNVKVVFPGPVIRPSVGCRG